MIVPRVEYSDVFHAGIRPISRVVAVTAGIVVTGVVVTVLMPTSIPLAIVAGPVLGVLTERVLMVAIDRFITKQPKNGPLGIEIAAEVTWFATFIPLASLLTVSVGPVGGPMLASMAATSAKIGVTRASDYLLGYEYDGNLKNDFLSVILGVAGQGAISTANIYYPTAELATKAANIGLTFFTEYIADTLLDTTVTVTTVILGSR